MKKFASLILLLFMFAEVPSLAAPPLPIPIVVVYHQHRPRYYYRPHRHYRPYKHFTFRLYGRCEYYGHWRQHQQHYRHY